MKIVYPQEKKREERTQKKKKRERKRTDSLIHTQNQTRCLNSSLDSINLDKARLPHIRLHIIPNPLIIKINTSPHIPLPMLHTQPVKNIRRIKASIITQLAGNDLQRLRKRLDDRLLLMRHVPIGIAVQVTGKIHLRCTTARDDVRVSKRALDDHDGIVETAFGLCDELFRAAAEDEGAGFGGGAVGEDVKALATDLALFEGAAGS